MKAKLIALILALTVVSWAQTATPNTPPASQQSTAPAEAKACACCDKGASADTKASPACCSHHTAAHDGKEAACCAGEDKAACCRGKNAKSCKRDGADQTAAACCGAKQCGKDCEIECRSGKQGEKAANSCCSGHCTADASDHASAGGGN